MVLSITLVVLTTASILLGSSACVYLHFYFYWSVILLTSLTAIPLSSFKRVHILALLYFCTWTYTFLKPASLPPSIGLECVCANFRVGAHVAW